MDTPRIALIHATPLAVEPINGRPAGEVAAQDCDGELLRVLSIPSLAQIDVAHSSSADQPQEAIGADLDAYKRSLGGRRVKGTLAQLGLERGDEGAAFSLEHLAEFRGEFGVVAGFPGDKGVPLRGREFPRPFEEIREPIPRGVAEI